MSEPKTQEEESNMLRIEIVSALTGNETSMATEIYDMFVKEPFIDELLVTRERTSTITDDRHRNPKTVLIVHDLSAGRATRIAVALVGKFPNAWVEINKLAGA